MTTVNNWTKELLSLVRTGPDTMDEVDFMWLLHVCGSAVLRREIYRDNSK